MKKNIAILFTIIAISGCELIVIGSVKQKKAYGLNPDTPIGAVLLFKTEIDSNNIPAAAKLLASQDGKVYLAFEKYELYDELTRFGRIIRNRGITAVREDSLAPESYRVNLELDYNHSISFTASKISDNWYITNYRDETAAIVPNP
ncbi:MAG: hypothetical protein HW421_1585 [Ignavibacteria bacterium]|nr:hypothetical protein [Ignavibacteria bacterium]